MRCATLWSIFILSFYASARDTAFLNMRCTCRCDGQPIPSSKFALDDDPQVCMREKAGRERKGGGREGGIHRDTERQRHRGRGKREKDASERESAREGRGGRRREMLRDRHT